MSKKKMSVSEVRGKKKESEGGGEARQAAGGELHQTATGQHPNLTTNQGVALSDNQNSLKANPRGPSFSKISSSAKKLLISTTSVFLSVLFTREPQEFMDSSN